MIATFGFLEPHKGLPALLDAAAAVGDVDLLLIGSTRERWAEEWLAGLDLPELTAELEREGVQSFCESYDQLLRCIESKLTAIAA